MYIPTHQPRGGSQEEESSKKQYVTRTSEDTTTTIRDLASFIKCIHNGPRFLFMDPIIDFYSFTFSRVKGDWIQFLVVLGMRQDTSNCKIKCMNFHDKGDWLGQHAPK